MGMDRSSDQIDGMASRFLSALFQATAGDSSIKISMYDIGKQIGMNKDEAGSAAENIMAEGLAEVRTLAGDIGLTQEGVALFQATAQGDRTGAGTGIRLGEGALLEADARRGVERVITGIKQQLEAGGLGFDALAELVADLRTIDVQLTSPRPKTAILRACFKSILGLMVSVGITDTQASIKDLLA